MPPQPWDAWLAAWMPRLPDPKREAIARLRNAADRAQSVLGIALLGAALRARGLPFEPHAVEYPPRRKPRLRDAPEFSIAHAHGVVACALAPRGGCVGVDLELRDAVRPDQLRLVLDDSERAALASGALSATDAWVMKEAVLKAAGEGIDAARRVVLHGDGATLGAAEYALVRVDLARTHVGWLATGAPAADLRSVALHPHDACEVLALPGHA